MFYKYIQEHRAAYNRIHKNNNILPVKEYIKRSWTREIFFTVFIFMRTLAWFGLDSYIMHLFYSSSKEEDEQLHIHTRMNVLPKDRQNQPSEASKIFF